MTPSHPGARRLQVLCVLAAPKGWPLQPPLGSLGPPGEVAPGWTVRLGCGAGSRSEGCQQGPRTPRGRRAGMLTREIEVVVQRPGVGALCCLLKRPAEKARDTGTLAGHHLGPQATLDGSCPPPQAQPCSALRRVCPPRPTELCGAPQACMAGWDGPGEGRGEGAGHRDTGPARLKVEKAIPGLALRLDPLDPATELTSFCPSYRSLGGCPPWSQYPAPRSGGRPSPRAAACSAGSLSARGMRTSITACARTSTPSAQEP